MQSSDPFRREEAKRLERLTHCTLRDKRTRATWVPPGPLPRVVCNNRGDSPSTTSNSPSKFVEDPSRANSRSWREYRVRSMPVHSEWESVERGGSRRRGRLVVGLQRFVFLRESWKEDKSKGEVVCSMKWRREGRRWSCLV